MLHCTSFAPLVHVFLIFVILYLKNLRFRYKLAKRYVVYCIKPSVIINYTKFIFRNRNGIVLCVVYNIMTRVKKKGHCEHRKIFCTT